MYEAVQKDLGNLNLRLTPELSSSNEVSISLKFMLVMSAGSED